MHEPTRWGAIDTRLAPGVRERGQSCVEEERLKLRAVISVEGFPCAG